MINRSLLQRFAPDARPELVEAILAGWPMAVEAGISTPLRVQHFLAQIATETGGFRSIAENLDYRTARRLMEVWPTRFRSEQAAKPFLRNPEKLAEKVYGGRLGNNRPGDGWKYRGGGFIQTTGRDGYAALGAADDPDLLRTPVPGFAAAVAEWKKRGCNALADRDDLVALRRAINGGTNGLEECRRYLVKARELFAAAPIDPNVGPAGTSTELPGRQGLAGSIIAIALSIAAALIGLLRRALGRDAR